MCSVISSQCRDQRMGVMWLDLGALTRAREFWICRSRVIWDLGSIRSQATSGKSDQQYLPCESEVLMSQLSRCIISPCQCSLHVLQSVDNRLAFSLRGVQLTRQLLKMLLCLGASRLRLMQTAVDVTQLLLQRRLLRLQHWTTGPHTETSRQTETDHTEREI